MGGLLSATPEIGNVQWKTLSSSFLRLPSVPFYNTSPCEAPCPSQFVRSTTCR